MVAGNDAVALADYLLSLVRRWKLIAAVGAVALGTGAGINAATPPTYEASVPIRVAPQGSQPVPGVKAYLDLAKSDGILQELDERVRSGSQSTFASLEELRAHLSASQGADPGVIALSVRAGDAQQASRVSQLWAAMVSEEANSTAGPQGKMVTQLEAEAQRLREQLQLAEGALTERRRQGNLLVLRGQLDVHKAALASLYGARFDLQMALDSAASLRSSLSSRSIDSLPTQPETLAMLAIQSRTVSSSAFLRDLAPMPTATIGAQLSFLEDLDDVAEAQLTVLDTRIAASEKAIGELTEQVRRIEQDEGVLATGGIAREGRWTTQTPDWPRHGPPPSMSSPSPRCRLLGSCLLRR